MKSLGKNVDASARAQPAYDSREVASPTPVAALEAATVDHTQFPALRALTGTVDDDDAPGDEHARENEAAARETSEDTEAPEEFGR